MRSLAFLLLLLLTGACAPESAESRHAETVERVGEHGGRLLEHEDVALELLLFEGTGTPEYRAWIRKGGAVVSPEAVALTVTLERLGGEQDVLSFTPVGTVLISNGAVREPHSFVVTVELKLDGGTHRWRYESIDGRTRIEPEMAAKFGLAAEPAGSAVIRETLQAFGTVTADPARSWSVQARFPGVIRSVAVEPGDRVTAGSELARVESDESLKTYAISAPASGVVVERRANVGEQTAGRPLFRIVDPSQVWAMLKIFPADRARVRLGQTVSIQSPTGEPLAEGAIDWIALEAEADQSVLARVVLANPGGQLLTGMRIVGEIAVAEHAVDLAVRRSALQSFRDFTVVYRRVEDVYEVRMLNLGRRDDEWVEVLDGLNVGDVYVTENSYLVKADIDKDSAAHEH